MRRIIYILGFLGSSYLATFAQQAGTDTTIVRNIEVVREYNPVIQEAGKINTMPELKDIEAKKIDVKYAVWTTPFSPKNDVIPSLDYATVSPLPEAYYKEGFVKVGGGNYTSFLGELYTPIYKNTQSLLDFYFKHNSSFGNVKLRPELYPSLNESMKSKALKNDNKAKVSFLRSVRNRELSSFVGFEYDRFDYYGYDSFTDSIQNGHVFDSPRFENSYKKQAFTNLDVNLRYRTKDYVSKWKYDLQTNYQLFRNKNKLAEHTIYTDVNGNYRMENSALGAKLEMYNIFMSRPDSMPLYDFERAENMRSHTVIKLNPYYTFEGSAGVMVIGIKGAFSIGQGKPGAITPDIYGTVKIIKDKLYLYAGVTGDFEVNNYRHATKLNPYISPDQRIEDTYTPIDVYAGTKINLFNQVNVDFFLGYKIINNPYFFVNRLTATDSAAPYYNTFDVVYEKDAGLFNAGLSATYNWNDKLGLVFKSKYNNWFLSDDNKPWQKPAWELDFQTSYNVTDYLRLNLTYRLEAKRYALINGQSVSMKDVHDLSLGANYKLMSFINLFLNLNNLIGSEYADWYGYTNHRFNVMGGLSVSF